MSNADKLITEITDYAEFYRGASTTKELIERAKERVQHIREEVLAADEPRELKFETEESALPMAAAVLVGLTMLAIPFVLKDMEEREAKANESIDDKMDELYRMLGKTRPKRKAAGF